MKFKFNTIIIVICMLKYNNTNNNKINNLINKNNNTNNNKINNLINKNNNNNIYKLDDWININNLNWSYLMCNENLRGFGGHCLPKDTSAWANLIKNLGLNYTMIDAVISDNKNLKK